jgi:hypothetical protein
MATIELHLLDAQESEYERAFGEYSQPRTFVRVK